MRRLFIAVMGFCAVTVAAPAAALDLDLNITAGLDFGGKFDGSDISEDASTGYSLGLELMFNLPVVELGIGAEYGFDRSSTDSDVDVSYTNLYAVGRVNFLGPLYAVARYGYSDLSADLGDVSLDGGGAWSLGAGVKFLGRFRVEALFNNFSGSLADQDLDYQTWSLRAMVSF